MNRKLFNDAIGTYYLLDYNRSHSELLLRSRSKEKKPANTDIIFKSVHSMFLPTWIDGLEIFLIDEVAHIDYLVEQFYFNVGNDHNIYQIRNKSNHTFYINAGTVGVFKNNFDILESSLGDITWSKENNLVLWHPEK